VESKEVISIPETEAMLPGFLKPEIENSINLLVAT
jgi:hypothetical protein